MLSHKTTVVLAERLVWFLNLKSMAPPVIEARVLQGATLQELRMWADAPPDLPGDYQDPSVTLRTESSSHYKELQRDLQRLFSDDASRAGASAFTFIDDWSECARVVGSVGFKDGRVVLDGAWFESVSDLAIAVVAELAAEGAPGAIRTCRLCKRWFFDNWTRRGPKQTRRGAKRLNCVGCKKH
jgi:hypothetical protein